MSDMQKFTQFLPSVCLICRILTWLENFRHEFVVPNISAPDYDPESALSDRAFEDVGVVSKGTCDLAPGCRRIKCLRSRQIKSWGRRLLRVRHVGHGSRSR